MCDKSKTGSVSNAQFETALNEISLLRDKLDSKSCALIILSQELLECKAQRDQFKLMGEQLRDRYGLLKRKMEGLGPTLSAVYDYDYDIPQRSGQNEPLAQLLITLKEQNKHLIREIDDLRMKLEDAEGDLKIVRGQMRTMSQHIDSAAYESRDRNIDINIISELEFYKNKVILLERDLQSVLDEKEELVLSRDSYKLKTDRLNEKLNNIMRSTYNSSENTEDNRIVDIDSLFMENRFLKERIKSFEEEKQMISLRLSKYKEILEKKRFDSTKGILSPKVSLSSSSIPSGNVISARQIEQLIATDALNNMEVSASNLAQLRNLVMALFDGLQDKSISLSHAKKTNKMLGKRIEELETQMRSLRTKDKMQIIKTSSLDSTSSGATTSNHEDLATPEDIDDENDGQPEDDRDLNDDELPPELDRLVKEAINDLKNRELDEKPFKTGVNCNEN